MQCEETLGVQDASTGGTVTTPIWTLVIKSITYHHVCRYLEDFKMSAGGGSELPSDQKTAGAISIHINSNGKGPAVNIIHINFMLLPDRNNLRRWLLYF